MNESVVVQGLARKDDPTYQVRESLSEFLAIPLAMLLGFLLLGLLSIALERANPAWLRPVRNYIGRILFPTPDTTAGFLGAVGGGLITMTSIIFSMLLLMLQQSASNMGNMIYDQFLNRRHNQIYVGVITGSVILALIELAAVSETFNPILGAILVLLVVFISLGMIVFFLYSAINQMRPEFVVTSIKEQTVKARKDQLSFLNRTRRERQLEAEGKVEVQMTTSGYVNKIDLDHIETCLKDAPAEIEIVMHATEGTHVIYKQCVADVVSPSRKAARQVAEHLGPAFHFTQERNLAGDPAYGLQQLEMVAWTAMSTAKQNPETGLIVTRTLGDLMARWMEQERDLPEVEKLPVVYPDNAPGLLLASFASLAAVSAESKQEQNYAEVLTVLGLILPQLSPDLLERAEESIRRTLPVLEKQMLLRDLDNALLELAQTLEALGRKQTAARVYEARKKKEQSQ